MKTAKASYRLLSLLLALPMAASATTVVVNGAADVPGVSYQTLSGAVNYVQGTGSGPHVVNIMTDTVSTADGQVVISTPMTINGDGNSNGIKADILVDMAAIEWPSANLGTTDSRCYIEVTSGPLVINDLKIHPNADNNSTDTLSSVDGIRLYEPASGSTSYQLNRVWVSGSDAGNNFVDLATPAEIYASTPKRWSFAQAGTTVASGNNAVIQVVQGAGNVDVALNNCMAGLGESNAVNLNARGGTYTITGGLYGHVARDGIRVTGNNTTLTGSPTNRLRVVRSTNSSGGDGHAVEIYGSGGNAAAVTLMNYVDVAGMNTSQLFKVWGAGVNATVTLMEYCRGLGKLSPNGTANNPAVLLNGSGRILTMRNCTIVGAAGSTSTRNPLATDPSVDRDTTITNCIFTSEDLGVINAANTDGLNGIVELTNCAIPTDGDTSESLAAVPITGNLTITPTGTVTNSPTYMQILSSYDWTEAAVSVDGSNTSAGNPNVLRPTDPAYATAATGGLPLVGGAGPAPITAVNNWSVY